LAAHSIATTTNKDQIVIVLHLQCGFAKTIARAAGNSAHSHFLDNHISECNKDNVIPNVVLMMPRWTAYKLLRKMQVVLHKEGKGDPRVSSTVERLSQPAALGRFWYLVLSRGKMRVDLPFPST
jgi:hypothetical protein